MLSRKNMDRPIMTAVVELNSKDAYEAIDAKVRPYPRFLPVPDSVVTFGDLNIQEWYRDLMIFPECIVIVGEDIELGGYDRVKQPVLGYSMGLGVCHNSMVKACTNGTPRDIQVNKWYEFYTDETRIQSEKIYSAEQIPDIREISLDICVDGFECRKFDYNNILFDVEYLLKSVSRLITINKYDVICLGPVSKPVFVPESYRFKKGDFIKISGEPFVDLVIKINENRQ